jgi:hypothetical protein
LFEREATETSEVGSMERLDHAWSSRRKTSLHLRKKTPQGETSRAAEACCAS